ncbi:MAG TPA: T9SS type A sorting domain-containing protein [bacterium]|jgi:hypothetical protein
MCPRLFALLMLVLLDEVGLQAQMQDSANYTDFVTWDAVLLPPDSSAAIVVVPHSQELHPAWEADYPYRVNQFSFRVDSSAEVMMEIFDVGGNSVSKISPQFLTAGYYHVRIDRLSLPDGVYIIRLAVGQKTAFNHAMLFRPKQ